MHDEYIEHHGIKGQRWGLRRYQNPDGSLTELGRKRLGFGTKSSKKATKGLNKLSTKELKGLIEKTKLAEELKDLQRKGKSSARSARMETVKNALSFRNDLRTTKLEKKSKIAQEKIRKEQAEDDAKNEKRRKSADKWKHRGTKWTNMVKVSKALKVFGNDMGLTKKENGETVIGDAAKFFKRVFKDAGVGKKDKSFDIDDKKDWDVDSAKDYGDFDVGKKTQKAAKKVAEVVNSAVTKNTVKDTVKETMTETMDDVKKFNSSNEGLFSFEAPDSASSMFSAGSFKNIDFATIKGNVIPLFNWDDVDGSASWDTVKARRKDGQPDKRYKPLEYPTGSRWSDELENALIHGDLSFDGMLDVIFGG